MGMAVAPSFSTAYRVRLSGPRRKRSPVPTRLLPAQPVLRQVAAQEFRDNLGALLPLDTRDEVELLVHGRVQVQRAAVTQRTRIARRQMAQGPRVRSGFRRGGLVKRRLDRRLVRCLRRRPRPIEQPPPQPRFPFVGQGFPRLRLNTRPRQVCPARSRRPTTLGCGPLPPSR